MDDDGEDDNRAEDDDEDKDEDEEEGEDDDEDEGNALKAEADEDVAAGEAGEKLLELATAEDVTTMAEELPLPATPDDGGVDDDEPDDPASCDADITLDEDACILSCTALIEDELDGEDERAEEVAAAGEDEDDPEGDALLRTEDEELEEAELEKMDEEDELLELAWMLEALEADTDELKADELAPTASPALSLLDDEDRDEDDEPLMDEGDDVLLLEEEGRLGDAGEEDEEELPLGMELELTLELLTLVLL